MSPEQPRTPLAIGMMWASRITGFGLQVAILAAAGNWIDRRFSTLPWGTLAGTAIGFTSGLMYLLRIAKEQQGP